MSKRFFKTALLALLALALTACGGGFKSGLSKGKQLDALSQSEAVQLCEAVELHFLEVIFPEQIDFFCDLEAIVGSIAGEGDCEQLRQECLDEMESELEEDLAKIEEWCRDSEPPACTGTVGLFEDCINDLTDVLLEQTERINDELSLSCGMTMDELFDALQEFEDNFAEPEEPASCKELDATCEGGDF